MPTFPAFTITAFGIDMQAQAETGLALTFTRIALGAGAADDPAAATDLVDERMTSDIQQFTNMGAGSVRLRAVFSNSTLGTGFGMSEVGVFALDPTTHVEKLHSYTKTSTPDYMPPSTGPTLLEQIFDAIIVIGSATSVTAAIDDMVMLATKDDILRPLLKETIGVGGAEDLDLLFSPSGFDEIEICISNLFSQSCKAYLQAEGNEGIQESLVIGATGLDLEETARVWLSRAGGKPPVVGSCSGLDSARSVVVVGDYAYIVNSGANTLSVINISNPTAPVIAGTCSGLSTPVGLAISGNYAYVANSGGNNLKVINISNPASPSIVATATGVSAPYSVAVVGNYAYVTNAGTTSMSVINISTPTSPTNVGQATGLSVPYGVAVVGNYAYVANNGGNNLKVINISNPASPSVVGTCSGLTGPVSVAVVGNYAYVSCGSTFVVVVVSNPASPTIAGTVTGLSGAVSVDVIGNYAYVACYGANTLSVIDISTPTAPVIAGTCSGLTGPYGVAVAGNYAYVGASSTFSVVDISTPTGGKITLWPGENGAFQFDAVFVTGTGRRSRRSTGVLPAWDTQLKIQSQENAGLMAGGSVVVRGRRAAPTGVSETAPEDTSARWELSVWYNPSTGAVVSDMSATGKSVSDWFPVGDVGDMISMTPVWPATGSPVGVLTLEQTNESGPTYATVGDTVDLSGYYTAELPEPNPDGSAGRKPVLVPAAGAKMRWAYTRTSGGAGAHLVVYCAEGT